MTISDFINQARHRVGISTYALSKITGIPAYLLSKYFNGLTKPSAYNFLLICHALGVDNVPVNQFFDHTRQKPDI